MNEIPVQPDFSEAWGILEQVGPEAEADDGLIWCQVSGNRLRVGAELQEDLRGMIGAEVSIVRIDGEWSLRGMDDCTVLDDLTREGTMLTTDIYKNIRRIYECKICKLYFPIWMVPNEEWRRSGFRKGKICKKCFERIIPSPRYFTLDEYVEQQTTAAQKEFDWSEEESRKRATSLRERVIEIWDMPSEYDLLSPELKTEHDAEMDAVFDKLLSWKGFDLKSIKYAREISRRERIGKED